VEELLEFSGLGGGQMTTDYISLGEGALASDAVAAVREFGDDMETLTHIFLVDETEALCGVVHC